MNNNKLNKPNDDLVCVVSYKTFQDYAWLYFGEITLTEEQLKKAKDMFWKNETPKNDHGPLEGAIIQAINEALDPKNNNQVNHL